MSSARKAWKKVPVPAILLLAEPGTVCWQKDLAEPEYPGGHLSVFVSPDYGDGHHLSISHRYWFDTAWVPGRYPTWDEIVEIRYEFAAKDITMALLLPPKEEYVNLHSTTFHLWSVPADRRI